LAKILLLANQIKSNFTDEELALIEDECGLRKLALGPCVRAIVNEYFAARMTKAETAILEAVSEFRALYLDERRLALRKELSEESLEETAERNRLRRTSLAREFLCAGRENSLPGSADDFEDED
jgi:hypothetical protein